MAGEAGEYITREEHEKAIADLQELFKTEIDLRVKSWLRKV